MTNSIIPEIMGNNLVKDSNSKLNTLNINLNQNIDKRQYEVNHQNYTTNNTTYNTVNKKGFFRFILEVILLPITLTYSLIKYIFVKYDLKNKFELERIAIRKDKLKRKMFNNSKSVWGLDEVY